VSGHDGNWQDGESQRLIGQITRRLALAAMGSAWAFAMVCLLFFSFALLLVRRLGGLGPELLTPGTLVGMALVAALLAVLFARKPTVLEAARKIDASCGASDLFLTLVQLESSAGAYQQLISEQAELQADGVVPSVVVPWKWQRTTVRLLVAAGVLVSAVQFVPQFDPFGAVDSAMAAVTVRRDLQASRQDTAIRLAELSSKEESATLSDETSQSLAELAAELQQLRADRSSVSLQNLEARQREIEARWRDARGSEEVSRLLEQAQANQFLGASDKRRQHWAQELAKGSADSIGEAFDSVGESLDQLVAADGEADRKELDKQVRQAMAELQRFAGNQLQSRAMESAMKRAMSQLDAGRLDPGLQAEAVEAARETLELAEAELQELAEQAAQLASLENALNAIQSARQLANKDSQQTSSEIESTIQDFVDQYANLKGDERDKQRGDQASSDDAQAGRYGKPGQNGQFGAGQSPQPGQNGKPELQTAASTALSKSNASGNGGGGQTVEAQQPSLKSSVQKGSGRSSPRENQLAKSGFRNSREAASVDASRRLLSMRRQGLSEAGESSQEYRELVHSLRKRMGTAIEVEEVPPGYVSGIRSYFDSLEPQSPQLKTPPSSSQKSHLDPTQKPEATVTNSGDSEAIDEVP